MIKKYSLKLLQKAINHALALDESSPPKLDPLQGKVLEIIIAPLGANFFITFDERRLILLDRYDGHPDTIIHSNPLGLIRLSILPASRARSLFNDKIRLSGDAELGYEVKQLFDELDIDWESHLARFTGDVVSHQIGSIVRKGISFKNQWMDSMHHNVSNYLHEEARLFPSREEINDFFNDIDELALDVERLQATINLLTASHEID
ncbi:ubiquinone biosynthesis accessory factor UbiJ [Legionella spiritensis]|uniref:Ubiquinone biosynthesis accessory factor UbiJ n=1 Tax=Legionella spiritensis TaxID=452 RepID=A0A0W0YWL1_LEGSP|nr:SCP2 sterol-binding domain-containing protein [Legionella spiritensis]KTD61234.1 SCP-2 sterol transfer family protein [Legionella spiritensis]SNV23707.1 Protein YigP [Legionella spiritensis]